MENLRSKIDVLDDKLVVLFEERMNIAEQIGQIKRAGSLPVEDRTREREIINRLTKNQSDEMAGYAKILYSTIFDLSRYTRQVFLLKRLKRLCRKHPSSSPKALRWLVKAQRAHTRRLPVKNFFHAQH